MLHIAFDWRDDHLHTFHLHGKDYGSNGAEPRHVRLGTFRLRRGERFRDVYDDGASWQGDRRLAAGLPCDPTRFYPGCGGAKRAALPEECGGAWAYRERLAQHRLSPPLDARGVVAEAIRPLLESDPQTSVREALGDLDDLRDAGDCLEAYPALQPAHGDRRHIKRHLPSRTWEWRRDVMQVTGQVVTRTDDGQEITKEVAWVERDALTPATCGVSLAAGKSLLEAIHEVVVAWQLHASLHHQRRQTHAPHRLSPLAALLPEHTTPALLSRETK